MTRIPKTATGSRKTAYPVEFIRDLPKSDLHVHLDGSIRLRTLIDLARELKLELPSCTVEGLRRKVFKAQYANLIEYLYPFRFTVGVLQTPEALERAAYELAWDCIDEGVVYVEVRFAPQLHVNERQDMTRVLQAVNAGLNRARVEHDSTDDVVAKRVPKFQYGIIVSALRKFEHSFSHYYRQLFQVHPHSRARDIYAFASLEAVKGAVQIRDRLGLPIVGFDLAGEEAGFPAEHHLEAFDYAHRHFLKKTVHAGEAYGPESIFQAITDLKADRIGHGYYLFNIDSITDPAIVDKEKYVRELSEYIADRRITIEVCLTSNLQTNPRIGSIDRHEFRKMREFKLSTTFCTDNRTVSCTTVTDEVHKAANTFGLGRRELKDILIYGFKRSFFPGTYIEKREYVREVIDRYERVEQQYFGSFEPKQ